MNFLSLTQRLRQEVGAAGTGPASVANQTGEYARLVSWISLANQEIQNKWLDWNFLWEEGSITTVSGQRDYDMPAGFKQINQKTVLDSRGETLQPLSAIEYAREKAWMLDFPPGHPDTFTILPNKRMRLIPTPNNVSTISFEYWRAGAPLIASTDEPLIPAEHHDAILWRAKMFWAEYDEAPEQYQQALTNFNLAMIRLEAAELPAEHGSHGRVEGASIVVRTE